MSSLKRKFIKLLYPFILKLGKKSKNGTILENKDRLTPRILVDLNQFLLNTGRHLELDKIKGKKILIVNTASDCGYTAQYAELQCLFDNFEEELLVIAVPANDFGKQEKGSDAEILEFCQVNYGVTFPVTKKSVVVKGDQQHAIYKWLTDAALNGWNNHAPDWNFSKYLINEDGILTHYFGASISPLEDIVLDAIKSKY